MLHLDIPTQAQIDRLSQVRAPAAVTIYLAATPLTQDADQTRISLKNHLREAVTQMEAGGVDKRDIWPIEEALASWTRIRISGRIRPTALPSLPRPRRCASSGWRTA